MVEARLLKYVEDALVKGYDDDTIEDHLVKCGWKKRDVKAALATAHMAPGFEEKIAQIRAGKTEEEFNVPNLGFFGKIKYILFKPRIFFNNVFDGAGLEKPFLFYLVLACFSAIIYSAFLVWEQASDLYFQLDLLRVSGLVLLSISLSIAFLFLMSFLVYIFARLLKGNGDYKTTFNAIAYAYTPGLIFGAIPYVGIFFLPWAIVLEVYSLSKAHQFSKWRAFLAFIAPIILFILLLILLIVLFRLFMPELFVYPSLND